MIRRIVKPQSSLFRVRFGGPVKPADADVSTVSFHKQWMRKDALRYDLAREMGKFETKKR